MVGIVLVGLNGAGKSTLGKMLADNFSLKLMEVEDYWFQDKHNYENSRTVDEVSDLMLRDISQSNQGFVITGNIMNLSAKILNYVSHVFYLKAPVEVRMQRIEQREVDYWGELSSDDSNYEKRQKFREFARNRSSIPLEDWLEGIGRETYVLDGENSLKENVNLIKRVIHY